MVSLLAMSLLAAVRPLRANAAQPPSGTIEIMFVIDNSGSMRKNDPEFITPKVVETFVRGLPLEARVGMVVFDQTARLIHPLTPVFSKEAQEAFVAGLGKIDYKGQYTNSATGIERALYELKVNARKDAQKGIVFITDGIVDVGDPKKDQELNQWLKQDLTAESRSLGIRIFGIAFSEAADFVLIQAMASRTEGEYYRTYKAAEISGVLDNILNRLSPKLPEPEPPPEAPAAPPVQNEAAAPPVTQTPPPPPAAESRPQPQPALEGAAPPREGGLLQLVFVALALVVTVLAGVLVFFYLKQIKAMKKSVPPAALSAITPDAYLEDVTQTSAMAGYRLEIKKERVTIGRDLRNDVVIEKPTISSFHATIEYRNMVFFLEDQRSTNGTRLNEKQLEANTPIRLKSGDRIQFATFQYRFVIPNQIPFGETAMISMTALEGEESGSTVVIDLNDSESGQGLINCMQSHLLQLHTMGPKYREFITQHFAYDTLELIAAKAHENLTKTQIDGRLYCESFIQNEVFYLVCSLPVSISTAVDWYGAQYNGFTQFLMKWIKSDPYQSSQCGRLCVVTFGQDPATWVSLTIVPTREEEDPVEIMSVDFLNEAEKAMLALDFDHHGRVS
jgi:pSer/pThr/pTyr-binding forkhead associated (FHA) protein/Mg-chelatase subunit ChlD